jgi:hypothetical protein
VRRIGFEQFLEEQFQAPASSYPTLPLFPTTRNDTTCPSTSTCPRDNYTMYPLQNRFFVNAVYGEDQLRQRVAFAARVARRPEGFLDAFALAVAASLATESATLDDATLYANLAGVWDTLAVENPAGG